MFRCALLEWFSLGGGHALAGSLRRAAAWFAVSAACMPAALVTPWAMWAFLAVRLAAVIDAGRCGRRHGAGERWPWKPALLVVAISFGFAGVVRATAVENFRIPSSSMSPTLGVGDMIVGDKLSLHWRSPGRGEVVVFRVGPRDFVGRIVAVGGDTVAVRRGRVILNGADVSFQAQGPARFLDQDELSGRLEPFEAAAHVESLGGHRHRVFLSPHTEPDAVSIHDYPRPEDGCGDGSDDPRFQGAALTPTADGTACVVPPGTFFFLGDYRDNAHDSRHLGGIPLGNVRARVVGIWLGGHNGRWLRIGRIE